MGEYNIKNQSKQQVMDFKELKQNLKNRLSTYKTKYHLLIH